MVRKTLTILLLGSALLGLGGGEARAAANPWMIAAQVLQLLNAGPALPAFLQKSAASGTNPDFTYGVLQNAHGLQEQGLPPEAYLLKANEGLAKGYPPPKILPALHQTRRQTEQAGALVREAEGRGWTFPDPMSRTRSIQEFQWALMNQTPPSVLRSRMGQVNQAEYFPQAWKGWHQGRRGPPPWAQNKKPKEFKGKGPKGHGGPPWGQGNHGHGKNKGKFK
jgi:hypothetical protein